MSDGIFEIFLVCAPGLEQLLAEEAREKGFADPAVRPGGVAVRGGWPEVWRANLELRGAGRVLARLGSFMAFHLAQLDKRARKFPWADHLRADVPLRVEVSCKRSKIYHARAAAQRIEAAIRDGLGAEITPDADLVVKVRIDDNQVVISVDTSGEALHKRGHKEAVGKAPMRENLAAMFLRRCGFDGQERVIDPMCGSGTFVIEAAEIAAGLAPGRSRRFAFERLAGFDTRAWQDMRVRASAGGEAAAAPASGYFRGWDRDAGAVTMAAQNARGAGVEEICRFERAALAELTRPEGAPGLVMINPPYGTRIGDRKLLFALYGSLGQKLATEFAGWRVGLVTSDGGLARATALPFLPEDAPVAFGGLKVRLYRTAPLG